MAEGTKKIIRAIHVSASAIIALWLPNNYLNEIDFISNLYDQSDLWIPASMVILLFFFLTVFGIVITSLCKLAGLRRMDSNVE
jgi:cell division protein FtsX